ncbi:MAG: YdiU family protein [Sulfurimonadaceae bacterium]
MKLKELNVEMPYLSLEAEFHDITDISPLKNPFLISYSPDAAELLGVDVTDQEELLVKIMNGEEHLNGSEPFSMCYAGHQFGYFVPRLGDGRAINLGKTDNGWNLQLKGAGPTLYSRQGDGRAVLRSSIREYLMSEAMCGLHIATSRALALIGSEHDVARERWEKGAVVLRMSTSWIRFGTFEYFFSKKQFDKLEALADYAIAESYPHLKGKEDAYFLMFEELVDRTALLLAKWQGVGFNHGVMNTDNMSIAGLTIDYGPFAFLDDYDFDYICNHTDTNGRYAFGQQPGVAQWNLSMLMKALSPLVNIERMQEVLEKYSELYTNYYMGFMRKKLGLLTEDEDDLSTLRWLFGIMQQEQIDYNSFFRNLSRYDGDKTALLEFCELEQPLSEWLDHYGMRLAKEESVTEQRHKQMLATNPKYVLKNYMLQYAIDKADRGDYSGVEELLTLARAPFDEHPEMESFAGVSPKSVKNLKLSCSS